MRYLNRYVVSKHAKYWKSVGLELGLDWDMLDTIEVDSLQQSTSCFQKTLDRWLKLTPNATWKTLEVALTNVRRLQLGLDPVDNMWNGEVQ